MSSTMYCGLIFQIWMEYHVSSLSYGLFLVKNVKYCKEKGTLQAKLGDVSVALGMVYVLLANRLYYS